MCFYLTDSAIVISIVPLCFCSGLCEGFTYIWETKRGPGGRENPKEQLIVLLYALPSSDAYLFMFRVLIDICREINLCVWLKPNILMIFAVPSAR